MQEHLISHALQALEEQSSLHTSWQRSTDKTPYDGILILELKTHILKIPVITKAQIGLDDVPWLAERQRLEKNLVLLCRHIPPATKTALRTIPVGYLEGNGNFFLQTDTCYIRIETRPPLKQEPKSNRAFTKTGLKVIFFLLTHPDDTYTYRSLATHTVTSLGNIPHIVEGLRSGGFLLDGREKGIHLYDKEQLLQSWSHAYVQQLRPSLFIGRFRFAFAKDWQDWASITLPPNTWWGGEASGALQSLYLVPATLTLYSAQPKEAIMRQLRLIPDTEGNIYLYRSFWKEDPPMSTPPTISPLLTYAELLRTEDRRCIESAQKIYHAHLQHTLQTD